MQIRVGCPQCYTDATASREMVAEGSVLQWHMQSISVQVANDGFYTATCSKGHQFTAFSLEYKYQRLFALGCHGIMDGYLGDSVVSFASSFEEFQEMAIQAFLLHAGLTKDQVSENQSRITSHSERRLGAFDLMWLENFKTNPSLVARTLVEFRNDVVHKGMMPERAKTLAYGEAVRRAITENSVVLRDCIPGDVLEAYKLDQRKRRKIVGYRDNQMSFQHETFVQSPMDARLIDLDESLENAIDHRLTFRRLGL